VNFTEIRLEQAQLKLDFTYKKQDNQ